MSLERKGRGKMFKICAKQFKALIYYNCFRCEKDVRERNFSE